MIAVRVTFFLLSFSWLCHVDAISSSGLAKVKQATADLETLLAQPVSAHKADHDAVLKRIDELLSVIKTSGDAKAVTKYQGLVDSKKQAIDLAEKNADLAGKNVALQEQVTQSTTQIATQEKQLATQEKQLSKASKKLQSVGLSLPTVKTTVSQWIDEIDLFIDDFIKTATLLNLGSFEQKLNEMVQKTLTKATVQTEKNQIIEFKNTALAIIYKKSLVWFCEGLGEMAVHCDDMLQLLQSQLESLSSSDEDTFLTAVLENNDAIMLLTVCKEGTDSIEKMNDIFKTSCLQNGFAKKMFAQLDEEGKQEFDKAFVAFISSYEKVVAFLLDAIEMMNAHIDDLSHADAVFAQEAWQEVMVATQEMYTYSEAIDLFEKEVLEFFPKEHSEYAAMVPDHTKGVNILDLWDTFANKKFEIKNQTNSSALIPPPPPPPLVLFTQTNEPKVDASFDNELAAAVKKQKESKHDVVIPAPSSPRIAAKTEFLTELESKAQKRVDKGDVSSLEIQLALRLKTFEKLEARINRIGNFQNTAHDEIVSLKQQFDDLLYDKAGASYSPRGSMAQYFEDFPEIQVIESKLDKKMIDPKKVGMATAWTDDQKKRFEDKKKSLQASLEQKRQTVYNYGISLSLEAVNATQSLLASIFTQLKEIESENYKMETGIPSLATLEHDLTYLYFLVRFGIYETMRILPFNQAKMKHVSDWFINSVPQIFSLMDPLETLVDSFNVASMPDQMFGRRVIAPLFAIITMMEIFENQFQLQRTSQAAQLLQFKLQFLETSEFLYQKGIIVGRDFQGTFESFDDYIIRAVSNKKK